MALWPPGSQMQQCRRKSADGTKLSVQSQEESIVVPQRPGFGRVRCKRISREAAPYPQAAIYRLAALFVVFLATFLAFFFFAAFWAAR